MINELGEPTKTALEKMYGEKYGSSGQFDWGPRTRKFFGYYSPDDWYESVVRGLVTSETNWLDIGCGRDIFPSNKRLAKELSEKCASLVGVDPDATVNENPFLHRSHNVPIEDFESDSKFDLITLRMVAEHIANPDAVIDTIARAAKPSARIIIYTVNKYSPVPLITNLTPFRARHFVKKVLWQTEEKDTFPTAYLMNTRRTLARRMSKQGLQEELFLRLDDCRSFARWRVTLIIELLVRTICHAVRLPYPENCLLGVYRKG